MKRLLMSVAVMWVYGTMAFAGQQEQNTQPAESKSASTSMSTDAADTNANTNRASSTKAQAKEQKKNRRKPQKEDNRTQQEKDFDRALLGIHGG